MKADETIETPRILSLRCKAGVCQGRSRMGISVIRDEVDNLYPTKYGGLGGFMVEDGSKSWFIPVQNVVEVIFEDKKVKAKVAA